MRGWYWLLGFVGGVIILGFLAYAGLVETIETPYAVGAGVGAALIGLWLWLDRETLAAWGAQRGTKYTGAAVLVAVLAAAVTVAVNVIAYRYDKRWDVTSGGRFSLADQTKSVLEALDRPVKVLAFFTLESQGEKDKLETLLEGYQQHSTLLEVEWHDPLKEPVLAEQNKITSTWGTVILQSGEDTQRLESDFGEEAITNAIVRLTSGEDHLVCFTEGHGELDPDDDAQPTGLGASIVKLEGQNYTVQKTNLLREAGVPADCEILVVAAPQQDWLPPEREMLAAYLAGGGKVLMLLEPLSAPGLASDLGRYGVKVGDDLVLEQNPNYQLLGGDPSYIILDRQSFDLHPISEPIKGMAMLRVARSVDKGADVTGINVAVLARTTEQAWAETSLDPSVPMGPDPGQDQIGRVPLAAVAEIVDPQAIAVGERVTRAPGGALLEKLMNMEPSTAEGGTPMPAGEATPEEAAKAAAAQPEPPAAPEVTREAGGKLVVFGDSDFATNELVDQGNNQDLLLNSLAWLAGEEAQISIRGPEDQGGSLSMTLLQGILMGFITLVVAPGVAIGMAIATWRRRAAL